jgi:hypothetical protein
MPPCSRPATGLRSQSRISPLVKSCTPGIPLRRWRQGRGASGQLIGIEVRAAATVTASDARHLAWLRDQTGDAFAAGIVLHTGPYVFPVSDRIVAAPVSTLWS